MIRKISEQEVPPITNREFLEFHHIDGVSIQPFPPEYRMATGDNRIIVAEDRIEREVGYIAQCRIFDPLNEKFISLPKIENLEKGNIAWIFNDEFLIVNRNNKKGSLEISLSDFEGETKWQTTIEHRKPLPYSSDIIIAYSPEINKIGLFYEELFLTTGVVKGEFDGMNNPNIPVLHDASMILADKYYDYMGYPFVIDKDTSKNIDIDFQKLNSVLWLGFDNISREIKSSGGIDGANLWIFGKGQYTYRTGYKKSNALRSKKYITDAESTRNALMSMWDYDPIKQKEIDKENLKKGLKIIRDKDTGIESLFFNGNMIDLGNRYPITFEFVSPDTFCCLTLEDYNPSGRYKFENLVKASKASLKRFSVPDAKTPKYFLEFFEMK